MLPETVGDDELVRLRHEYNRLTQRHRQLEESRQQLLEELDVRDRRIDSMRQELIDAERSHGALQTEVIQHATEKDELRRTLGGHRQHSKKTDDRVAQLQEEVERLRERVPGLERLSPPIPGGLEVLDGPPKGQLHVNPEDRESTDRTEALLKLQNKLVFVQEGGWTYGSLFMLLLGCLWALCFCIVLDAAGDPSSHWLVFYCVQFITLIVVVVRAQFLRRREHELLLEDDYDAEALMFGHEPVRLGDDEEDVSGDAEFILRPCQSLLDARRPGLWLDAFLFLSHIYYLVAFALVYPNLCDWRPAQVLSPPSTQFQPRLGGTVFCPRADQYLGPVRLLEAAGWLARSLPLIWALTWHCRALVFAREGADAILGFFDRREELLCSPGLSGSEFFTQIYDGISLRLHQVLHLRNQARRTAGALLVDTLDGVDLLLTLVSQAQLFVAKVDGSPSQYFLLSDEQVQIGDPGLLWWIVLVCSSIALAGLAVSFHVVALCNKLNQAEITKENKHKIFILFMKGMFQMPTKNFETLIHATRALVTIDCPFFAIRLVLGHGLRIMESPMIIKNIVCILYHSQTVAQYFSWKNRVSQLRRENARMLKAFDAKLSDLSAATWDELGTSNVYDQMSMIYDQLEQPGKEFLVVYHEDIADPSDNLSADIASTDTLAE